MSSSSEASGTVDLRAEADRLRLKYPDRVGVIVTRAPGCTFGQLRKKRFLAETSMTVAQFKFVIRKRLPRLPPEEAMFLCTSDNSFPASSMLMSALHKRHQGEDGFLHLVYTNEAAFGY